MTYIIHHPFSVMTRMGIQAQVWTRLGLLSTMKIHKDFRETMACVVHHPFSAMTRPSGVQIQVWTRLGLPSTMKIY
jgi:hypothetical protein